MKTFSEYLNEDAIDDRKAAQILSDLTYGEIVDKITAYAGYNVNIKGFILYKMLRYLNIINSAIINEGPVALKKLEDGNYLTNDIMLAALEHFGTALHWGVLGYYTGELPEKYITPELIAACLKLSICNIRYVPHPTKEQITTALTDPEFIEETDLYTDFVKKIFKDNTVLLNKWMRYGENVRSM
jgi:hypothetical protein